MFMVHVIDIDGHPPDVIYFDESREYAVKKALNDSYSREEIVGIYEVDLLEGTETLPDSIG